MSCGCGGTKGGVVPYSFNTGPSPAEQVAQHQQIVNQILAKNGAAPLYGAADGLGSSSQGLVYSAATPASGAPYAGRPGAVDIGPGPAYPDASSDNTELWVGALVVLALLWD